MQKIGQSRFKDPAAAKAFLGYWNDAVQTANGQHYVKKSLATDLGRVVVWEHLPPGPAKGNLIFFHDAGGCGLAWDLDHRLAPLKPDYRLVLVDIVGQPGLSAGVCPDGRWQIYGVLAEQVLALLAIDSATLVGSGFGGLICLLASLTSPLWVERAVLMNPAGLSAATGKPLPWQTRLTPNPRRVTTAISRSRLHAPEHALSPAGLDWLVEHQLYALRNFKSASQRPPVLSERDLSRIETELHLILGDQDRLFPWQQTLAQAQRQLPTLKSTIVLPNHAHALEHSAEAIETLKKMLG